MELSDPILARIYQQITQGDLSAAAYALQKHLRRNPQDVETVSVVARFEISRGNMPGAINYLKQAIRRNPTAAVLHEELGLAISATGNRSVTSRS